MKLTADNRINAIFYVQELDGIPQILNSKDMNMTVNEYIGKCIIRSITEKCKIPFDIFDMDFKVESVHYNPDGHRFTVLGYKDEKSKKVCVINKLDLAGTY